MYRDRDVSKTGWWAAMDVVDRLFGDLWAWILVPGLWGHRRPP